MRRALAMILLVGFSIPLITPLLVSGPDEASLPACCRRNGTHRCMMMSELPSQNPTVTEKCPYSPFAGRSLMLPHAFTLRDEPGLTGQAAASAAMVRDAEAGYRVSADRTRQKRGPPTLS
jgi:hypothetical protein